MKSLLISIALFLPLQLTGQVVHFPLDVGNQWLYGTGRRIEVVGDTTLPNGKTYALSTDTDVPTVHILIRQQGDSVYYLRSPGDTAEYVQFDFSLLRHDTIPTHWGQYEVIRPSSPQTIFGIERTSRWFVECDTPDCYLFNDYIVADSVGIEYFDYSGLGGWPPIMFQLEGAIIAGKGFGTLATISSNDHLLPSVVALSQNYPNPFNPSTTIRYELPRAAYVSLGVFDLLGRRVASLVEGQIQAGTHTAEFLAGTLPSGVYIYRLQADRFSASRAMVILK